MLLYIVLRLEDVIRFLSKESHVTSFVLPVDLSEKQGIYYPEVMAEMRNLGRPLFSQQPSVMNTPSPFWTLMSFLMVRLVVGVFCLLVPFLGSFVFGMLFDIIWVHLLDSQSSLFLAFFRSHSFYIIMAFLVFFSLQILFVRFLWRTRNRVNPLPLFFVMIALSLVGGSILSKWDLVMDIQGHFAPRVEINFLGRKLLLQGDSVMALPDNTSPSNRSFQQSPQYEIQGDQIRIPQSTDVQGVWEMPWSGVVMGKVLSRKNGRLWVVDNQRRVWRINLINAGPVPVLNENDRVSIQGEPCGKELCAKRVAAE